MLKLGYVNREAFEKTILSGEAHDKVLDRLHPDDRLCRDWRSFEEIEQGDLLAVRHDRAKVIAEEDGWIVFPYPTAQVNQEWLYLAKDSDRSCLS